MYVKRRIVESAVDLTYRRKVYRFGKTRNRVWDYPFEYELLMVMQPWLLFQVIAISYVNTILENSLFIQYSLYTI